MVDQQGIIEIGAGRDENLPVESLRCLGPKSKQHLNAIGIMTVGDLKREGVMDTYLKLIESGVRPNLCYAWAMFAGLLDVDFGKVPKELKEAFKAELSKN